MNPSNLQGKLGLEVREDGYISVAKAGGKQRPPVTSHRNVEETMVPKPNGTVPAQYCIGEHSKRSCTDVKSNCST